MRRLPSLSILLIVFLGSLLPVVGLLAIAYFQAIYHTQGWLSQEVRQSVRRTDRLLETADDQLNQIAADTKGKPSPEALNLVRRTVYNDPRFREVEIVDERGFLVLTSLGEVNPPIPIPQAQRANPKIRSLQMIGLIRTALMQEKSLVLSLPTQGKGEVNLLVDPVVLTYFLADTELGPDGYIAFFDPNGRLITGVGALPDNRSTGKNQFALGSSINPVKALSLDPGQIRVQQSTRNGDLILAGAVPTAWALRYWWQDFILGVPLALLCGIGLTLLFVRFARRSYGIEQDIRVGLENHEFAVYYQPIIDLQTQRCVGSEALLRWQHPELGLILPGVFIPIIEKTGLIQDLSEWVIQKVILDQANLLQSADLYVSINLSPSLLLSKKFLENVRQTLLINALPADRILFEITENRLLETMHLDNMTSFRSAGLRLALDDFGSGYSSLDYLDRFEFDYLKIDRCFVQRIQSQEVCSPIVETLIELGRNLELELVAEGVETEVQRYYLQTRGVQYAQGWLFAKALPLEEFKQFLQNQPSD
jgi:sensor c-di-GMP phosphodiesterase-like protein